MKLNRKLTLEVPSVLTGDELSAFLWALISEFATGPWLNGVHVPANTELQLVVTDAAAANAVEALLDAVEPEREPVLVASNRIDITDGEALAILQSTYTSAAGKPVQNVRSSIAGRDTVFQSAELQLWLNANNLTVPELCVLLGMHKENTTPYNWLPGGTGGMPSIQNLAKLASLMELNPLDLIKRQP